MDKLPERLWTSVVLLGFVGAVLYVFPVWLFTFVVASFVAMAQLEFFWMMEKKRIAVYKYFGTAVGALLPVVVFLRGYLPALRSSELLLIVIASLMAFVLQFLRRDEAKDHVISVAVTLFSIFYISWFFSFLVEIRLLPSGADLVAYLILVTKSTDMGAYFIGARWGRKELIPRISPSKTREGSLGGMISSVLVSLVVGVWLTPFTSGELVLMGAMLGLFAQVGDLVESLIKRNSGIKDSAKYLNGIGGFMDLMDSLLLTAPAFYAYLIMVLKA